MVVMLVVKLVIVDRFISRGSSSSSLLLPPSMIIASFLNTLIIAIARYRDRGATDGEVAIPMARAVPLAGGFLHDHRGGPMSHSAVIVSLPVSLATIIVIGFMHRRISDIPRRLDRGTADGESWLFCLMFMP